MQMGALVESSWAAVATPVQLDANQWKARAPHMLYAHSKKGHALAQHSNTTPFLHQEQPTYDYAQQQYASFFAPSRYLMCSKPDQVVCLVRHRGGLQLL